MKMRVYIFWVLLVCLLQFPASSHAQEITKNVSGEAFIDHDFITVHRQGDDLFFKSSNPYDFITHPDTLTPFHPASFEYALTFPKDTIDQCSLNIITWGQPAGIGESARGFLGRISSDKTVFTGDGNFKVGKSSVTVNYAIDGGRPPTKEVWSKIISTAEPLQNVTTLTD